MAIDPETKKEIDAMNANILALKEELSAMRATPGTPKAEIQALIDELAGLKKDLADLRAGKPPAAKTENEEAPTPEDDHSILAGFWRRPC